MVIRARSLLKPWLSLGSTVVLLLPLAMLHLNTTHEKRAEVFETAFTSLFPALLSSYTKSRALHTDNTWQLPSYRDYVDGWQANQAGITLNEQDLQAPTELAQPDFDAIRSSNGEPSDRPLSLSQLGHGISNLGNRKDFSAFKPMFQTGGAPVAFTASDQAYITRYANQDHLPVPSSGWQQFDISTINLLAGFRRVVVDETTKLAGESANELKQADDLSQLKLEVAPGGGKYWLEDPNAAWW